MAGLTSRRPKISKVAQVLALVIAISSSICSYLLPKHVTTLPPHFWLIVGGVLLLLLLSLKTVSSKDQISPSVSKAIENRSLTKPAVTSEVHRKNYQWGLTVCLVPVLLHSLLYGIASFHFPALATKIVTPAGASMSAVTVYWLLIAFCVGIVRFFQQRYPQYFLYEACLMPLSKGVWRLRMLDYGLYVLLMSQVIFYALCISSVFLFILRVLQRENLAVMNLDAWYFSILLVGICVLGARKIPWRKVLQYSMRWRWGLLHWLVLFGMTVITLLGLPIAFSEWLSAKGFYTELHHYYLANGLFTLKENIGLTSERGWYLAGSLWVIALPWVMSLYCRFAGNRPCWWVALSMSVPALIVEQVGFRHLEWLISQVFSLKMACITCLLLLIYIALVFRKQTNNHRFIGGWLAAYPAVLSVKPRSARDGLGRLLRTSLMLFLLSAAGLWPVIQLQISLYAFGVLFVWSVITLSYVKQQIFTVLRMGLRQNLNPPQISVLN